MQTNIIYIILTIALLILGIMVFRKRKKSKPAEEVKPTAERELKEKLEAVDKSYLNNESRYLTVFFFKENVNKFETIVKEKYKPKFVHIEELDNLTKVWVEYK